MNNLDNRNSSTNNSLDAEIEMNGFKRIQTEIRTWWNGLLKPRKEAPVEKILENARSSLLIYAICSFFLMALIVYVKEIPYRNTLWLGEFLCIYLLINEWFYLDATRTSREERIKFEENSSRRFRRLLIFFISVISIAIVISQNFLGIGDTITAAFPWAKPASEATLNFINGVVEEYHTLFSH